MENWNLDNCLVPRYRFTITILWWFWAYCWYSQCNRLKLAFLNILIIEDSVECGTWWSAIDPLCGTCLSDSNSAWSMTLCMLHAGVGWKSNIGILWCSWGLVFCCVIAAFFILHGWVFLHMTFLNCSIRVSTTFDIERYIFCKLSLNLFLHSTG